MLIKLCLNSEVDATLPEWTLLEFQGEVIGDGGLGLAGNELGQIILKDVSDDGDDDDDYAVMSYITKLLLRWVVEREIKRRCSSASTTWRDRW
jgi:hypothetical protein